MLDPVFNVTVANQRDDLAQLVIEPLKQGYGHTLGNALRRVLLTSLKGAAITSIKVKGVKHQFSTLQGMSEDIVQLVLNLKTLRLSLDGKESETITLEAKGPGQIKASAINLPVGVTLSNPETVIANLADSKSSLSVEMTGIGYSPAEERKSTSIGVIPVDALFSPITRVNPIVQSTRVGRRTDFDKLILDVSTDGTISAKDALEQAAQILVEHFEQIIKPVVSPAAKSETATAGDSEVLKLTVEELDLPTRIANALRKGGYKTVADLTAASGGDIAKVKNLGERSVSTVKKALEDKGISLAE